MKFVIWPDKVFCHFNAVFLIKIFFKNFLAVKILHSKASVGLLTLLLQGINSDTARNYQLIDKESTGRISSADCQHSPSKGGIVILQGITCS
jgi:hypothetical protein